MPKPTKFYDNMKEPLRESFKKATSDHIINFYDYSEFSKFTKIAEEHFSLVHKCEWKEHGLTIALKYLRVNDTYLNKNTVRGFIEMVHLLQNSNHPNIVKLYGITKGIFPGTN
ncbi:34157_t:CDS:2 [Gigaspora margarita]|uniref:34157_t:CDS:1 n=1 Tax=Gigaspora margarita TaxID=4874 RepID=A0ABN7UNC5_GIGMA|nr:34157_t:CDS:2 [Gigaspora margarita]